MSPTRQRISIPLRPQLPRAGMPSARRLRHPALRPLARRISRILPPPGPHPLRKFLRSHLVPPEKTASGFLQRLRLLPHLRRSGRRSRRRSRSPWPCSMNGKRNWMPATKAIRATQFLSPWRETVKKFEIPKHEFSDLLIAFRQDQTVTRFETFDDVLAYCRYSANPVGHLVLYLCGYQRCRTPAAFRLHLHRAATGKLLAGRERRLRQGTDLSCRSKTCAVMP